MSGEGAGDVRIWKGGGVRGFFGGCNFDSSSIYGEISGAGTLCKVRGLKNQAPLMSPTPTFSLPFLEFSGFTRMDGGGDAGSFGRGSLLARISLPSMMRELAAEWILVSLPLLTHVRAGSPVAVGLGPISATTAEAEEGAPCGW